MALKNNYRLVFVISIVMINLSLSIYGQSLPNKQKESLPAPSGVKVDGLSLEWGGKYQAFNKSTEVFYTIANNKENLYLIIHAVQPRVIEKIIEGGIEFTVNDNGKQKNKKKLSVLFPLLPLTTAKGTLIIAGKPLTGRTVDANLEDITSSLNEAAKNKNATSFNKANKNLTENLKVIKLSGIKAITDTIPDINAESFYYRTLPLRRHNFKIIKLDSKTDIKAMVQFDQHGELTYELAIPLKYIQPVQGDKLNFYYNVTIHGRGEDSRPGNMLRFTRPPVRDILDKDLEMPTDFWGEYELSK